MLYKQKAYLSGNNECMIKKITYWFLSKFANKNIKNKPSNMNSKSSFYDFKLKAIDGKEIDFNTYKGKKVLIVNTASECGFTPQYNELQELHEKHGDKITVLGFPANDFGAQEPGSNENVAAFCSKNFGVTFQLFEKSNVLGENQNPLYKWLCNKNQNGWNEAKPTWNFFKYLIDENGELIKAITPAVSPMSDEIINIL